MAGRKDIDPASELLEDDDEQSLPETDELAAGEDARVRTLAAGRDVLLRHAKLAPKGPGVYRMLDAAGEVLYVGKAKSIRKRIVSYTRPTGHDTRIERVIASTASVEFVTTATETEALLLEANLIKRLRPRFNVLLRDDKSFPYILITGDHWAPQILKHRGARTRPGRYYGPFASVWAVNRTITALATRLPVAQLFGRLLREPHPAVPSASDQALFGALHERDRLRRLCRIGA
jgi:excinuclease ABC subunit C